MVLFMNMCALDITVRFLRYQNYHQWLEFNMPSWLSIWFWDTAIGQFDMCKVAHYVSMQNKWFKPIFPFLIWGLLPKYIKYYFEIMKCVWDVHIIPIIGLFIGSRVHDDVIKWKHFRVTGHLCGEFTGPRWISHTKASDAELWCFPWSASE